MSTNATIIVQRPDSDPPEFAGIYTHWDGYPSHHGKILLENYATHDKVVELIQLGNLSELHSTPDACVSHHRWRGDDKNINLSQNLNDHTDFQYAYLFRDGAWFFKTWDSPWAPLTIEACAKD